MSIPFICRTVTTQAAAARPRVTASAAAVAIPVPGLAPGPGWASVSTMVREGGLMPGCAGLRRKLPPGPGTVPLLPLMT